jgi:hypothetical protein
MSILDRSICSVFLASQMFGCAEKGPTNVDEGLSSLDEAGEDDGSSEGNTDLNSSDGSTTNEGEDDGDLPGIKFDFEIPDSMPDPGPIIPETCEQAEAGASTVGCRFFGADLDSHDSAENQQFAIAVSNVQETQVATVQIELKKDGSWSTIAGPVMVESLSLHTFNLDPLSQDDSGLLVGGAYRVTSDVPIIAYQFNPVDGGSSYLSDASMLYPVPTWDHLNQVVGWKVVNDGIGVQGAYISIIAAHDGTKVSVTPSVITLGGPGVPGGVVGVPFEIEMNEGDVAEVMTKTMNIALTGTRVETDPSHPVAVFSGNECALIPADVYACDHLEEQISGVRRWGQRFIGSRVPPRSATDLSLWQIYASEDATTVTLTADAQVTGLPASPFMLQAGEVIEFYAGGNEDQPGDFEIEADKPIAVLNYMTGAENPGADIGDPAMVQLSPIEQFLPRYVVLVPSTWIIDVAVVARPAGAEILLDGVTIPDELFIPIADSGYEVARVPVPDGIHVFDGDDEAFSIVILGYDTWDSYAYLGGTGTGVINPHPEG